MESPRWKSITPSQYERERRGLDFIRTGLPDHDPYRTAASLFRRLRMSRALYGSNVTMALRRFTGPKRRRYDTLIGETAATSTLNGIRDDFRVRIKPAGIWNRRPIPIQLTILKDAQMHIFVPTKSKLLRNFVKPIFIVGCSNSGTSILWNAILSHPALSGPPIEGQDLTGLPRCMTRFLGRPAFRLFAHSRFKMAYRLTESDYDGKTADRLANIYLEHLIPGTRFVEKSPPNSLRTRFIQAVFPDAFFVIVVRNGVAVSEGIRRKRWYDPDREHLSGLPTSIADAAEHWRRTNECLFHDRSHLRRSIVVRYEDLVTNPGSVLRRVFEFCECDPLATNAPEFQRALNEQQIKRLTLSERQAARTSAGTIFTTLGYGRAEECLRCRDPQPHVLTESPTTLMRQRLVLQ